MVGLDVAGAHQLLGAAGEAVAVAELAVEGERAPRSPAPRRARRSHRRGGGALAGDGVEAVASGLAVVLAAVEAHQLLGALAVLLAHQLLAVLDVVAVDLDVVGLDAFLRGLAFLAVLCLDVVAVAELDVEGELDVEAVAFLRGLAAPRRARLRCGGQLLGGGLAVDVAAELGLDVVAHERTSTCSARTGNDAIGA